MKVVYLNPTGVLGGAEMCLLDLLAALGGPRPGWSPVVILGDDGPLRAAVEGLGVPCDVAPLPAAVAGLGDAGAGLAPGGRGRFAKGLARQAPGAAVAASRYVSSLRRRLVAERPDLVQTNGMKAHLLGARAAPRGMPVVWHLHDYTGSRPLMSRLLRWSRRPGVRGVAVSESVAVDARRVLGPSVPVEPIYNAIDLDRFSPDGPAAGLDALAGLPPPGAGGRVVRVGLVATFARWKGHEVFLDAAARLNARGGFPPALRFYVVGGPIYRTGGSQHDLAELRARAESLGLGEVLGFTGHVDDPSAAFRALDVVVHASTRPEPFGRVIVEAMACQRAVVVSRTGGAAELFTDGITALGHDPGDAAGLAEAIGRLMGDPALRRALGEAGRRSAVERFDRKGLAGPWRRVYAEAGAGAAGPGAVFRDRAARGAV